MAQPSLIASDRTAVLSPCGRYRYRLGRHIGPWQRTCVFIMLNPSTADADSDDPTIRRCRGFAYGWRCGQLVVVNLFAFRATDPAALLQAPRKDVIGPDNDAAIEHAVTEALQPGLLGPGLIVCAWGAHGSLHDRDLDVLAMLRRLDARPQALALTDAGHPKHPLYLAKAATLRPFQGRGS